MIWPNIIINVQDLLANVTLLKVNCKVQQKIFQTEVYKRKPKIRTLKLEMTQLMQISFINRIISDICAWKVIKSCISLQTSLSYK